MTKHVKLYTDGSCLGNPGPGGWAALLHSEDSEKLITGGEGATTNNRMEMMAVIEGLEALNARSVVEIYLDSQYVMNAFEKGWLAGWQRKGWRTADGKPVKNQDLWERLLEATSGHELKWTWVRGHAGHPENEKVDEAARLAAQGFA